MGDLYYICVGPKPAAGSSRAPNKECVKIALCYSCFQVPSFVLEEFDLEPVEETFEMTLATRKNWTPAQLERVLAGFQRLGMSSTARGAISC